MAYVTGSAEEFLATFPEVAERARCGSGDSVLAQEIL